MCVLHIMTASVRQLLSDFSLKHDENDRKTKEMPEETMLKLSNAFENKSARVDVELTVRMHYWIVKRNIK